MRVDIAKLREWRHGLLEARASGVRSVRDQNGEEVTYKSDRELAAALANVEAEIRRMECNPPNTILFHTSKGL